MRIIDDEYALDAPKDGDSRWRHDYIRSAADHTYLICCRSGEVYTRRDGAPWEFPAYEIERDRKLGTVTRNGTGALGDSKRYPGSGTAKGTAKALRGAA